MISGIHHIPDAANLALSVLHATNVRLTEQRVELIRLLFAKPDRHISAEVLYLEVKQAGLRVSRATVYNVLHKLTESGILQKIKVETGVTLFDTNLIHHYHLYFEETGEIQSIPADLEALKDLPRKLGGIDPRRLDVLIRVRGRPSATDKPHAAKKHNKL